jgi:hypothetical protein
MHLVMLLDRYNGSIQVFKDKALVANSTVRSTNTVSSQNPLLFGKSQESNSDFSVINGQMDDIRLYDRVLYSFEIEDLFDVWRLIQTRMVSMMQRKYCSIPILHHRIPMEMG